MAPQKPTIEHIIDRTPEYEEFITNLKAFHEKRGTTFDPEPKMGNVNVDLLKLFKFIMEHGGYDKVSEEKLKWRQVCEGLGLLRSNAPADAYALKQIFYKNLAAYEIKTVHEKEPPPPEILEFVTAKGGGLLSRTLENFQARGRQSGIQDSDRSGDDATPSRDRKADEPVSTGRASRGLREAPPQRIPFTPDTHSTRQTRHASGHHSTPASNSHPQTQSQSHIHSHGPSPLPVHVVQQQQQQNHNQASLRGSSHAYNPPGADLQMDLVQNYQPPRIQPIHLRIVDTPTSNPEAFARKQRLLRPAAPSSGIAPLLRRTLPPGNLDGPNIYERCLSSLRSCIREEQAFALNHLVKISYERGDKYKFSQFHGLAEGLSEKALEVGSLFYHVNWIINYDPDGTICTAADAEEDAIGELDGLNGTADILDRISRLKPKEAQNGIQTAEFTDQMMLITEAVLTIRNMVMLPDNAYFMSDFVTLKDLLCIILTLPNKHVLVELKHFALDIAEQITPFLILDAEDALYRTLLAQLQSTDRGTILTALRAIGRIAMNSPTETNKLDAVPYGVLKNIMEWLLLNDDEMLDACLDFLYQYTAVVSNLEALVRSSNLEHLVLHLVRLLSHGAKRVHKDIIVSPEHALAAPPPEQIVQIPKDLLELMLQMEEPERCYAWLRCLFDEDPESQITQIEIWQAYNSAFLEPLKRSGRSMIQAADFIRNISQVYQSAGAQIVQETPTAAKRFIIKGIRPRPHPISIDGRDYIRCLWTRTDGHAGKCGSWLLSPEKMWEHILADHLGETRGDNNQFPNKTSMYACSWGTCGRWPSATNLRLFHFMGHVKTHIMAEVQSRSSPTQNGDMSASGLNGFKRLKPRDVKPAKIITLTYEETAVARDERNPNAPVQAAGIPLSAILVLRNIARNIVKTKAEERLVKEQGGPGSENGGWNERLFRLMVPRLFEIMAENRILAPHVAGLLLLLNVK